MLVGGEGKGAQEESNKLLWTVCEELTILRTDMYCDPTPPCWDGFGGQRGYEYLRLYYEMNKF
jgi:hypothetical protein